MLDLVKTTVGGSGHTQKLYYTSGNVHMYILAAVCKQICATRGRHASQSEITMDKCLDGGEVWLPWIQVRRCGYNGYTSVCWVITDTPHTYLVLSSSQLLALSSSDA